MIFLKNIHSIQINNLVWSFFDFPYDPNKDSMNSKLLHFHSHTELFFCSQGSINLNFLNEKITLNEKDVCLVPAGIKHTKSPDTSSDTIWGSIGLLCNKNESNVKYNESFDSRMAQIVCSDKIVLSRNNNDLCQISQKIISDKIVSTITLLELVGNLYKAATLNITEEISILKENNEKDIKRLLILDDIINNEYTSNLSNEEIADKLNISTRQLSRLVISNFGVPIHKLFIKRRLVCAATQLIETDDSIEKICYSVGFSNKTFFYQKFKEEFGVTPIQYRKEKQQIHL